MSYRNGSRVRASSVLLRQPHVKLRVALVCLVWGEEFADFFARYCVRSLLEPRNIPLVSREQEVTLLLYTDRPTRDFLERCDSFDALSKFVKVEVLQLEQLPATARASHWVPWQHAVAGRNGDFDLFLVIIPDCVYAAGSLGTIIDALEEHDTVYGTLPQVCRETVVVELEGLRRVDGHEYISFTSLQAVELFIRHVNPKHAAAACSGTFFVAHPEIAIQLSPESMVVSETGSHPFAVRSSTRTVSYTLDALSPGAKTCYLEILGVSAEPTLKFVEEYYRWPKLHRDYSRVMNLGSWAWNFPRCERRRLLQERNPYRTRSGARAGAGPGTGDACKDEAPQHDAGLPGGRDASILARTAVFRRYRGQEYCAHHSCSRISSSFSPAPVRFHRCPAQDGEPVQGGGGSDREPPGREGDASPLPVPPRRYQPAADSGWERDFSDLFGCRRQFSQGVHRRSGHRRTRCRLVGEGESRRCNGFGRASSA